MNFFSKIERHFAIPHDSNYTATKKKVCLGPGTEIQVTGELFCRKMGLPICSADFGGGMGCYAAFYMLCLVTPCVSPEGLGSLAFQIPFAVLD